MERTEPINVAIVDDQDLVRAGFAMVIGSQDDMTVVGQGANGEQAVDLASRLRPDVILMDVRMPGMDGLAATRQITALSPDRPEPRVIVLTTFDLDEYVMATIKAGASGFLLKDTEPETLLTSIRTVHQGNAIIAPSATKRLIEHMAHDMPATGSMPSGSIYRDPEADLLTDRELQVLVHIAQGLSNQEIADNLGISLPTVKTHVTHILQKINARDRVQAVVFAYENHLV